jgi:solute:Na+ symporter, SSS family
VFSLSDYCILGIYFLGIAFVGVKFYRKSERPSEFFVGGRAVAWLPVSISIVAADTSALTLLGNPGYSYAKNFTLIFLILAYSVAAWLVIIIFLPFYCRLNMYSAYEYLERRFDVRVRCGTSALFLIVRGSHVALAIYATALALRVMTGMSLHTSVLLMGVIATIYTTLGGIRAVIWTDVMQFSIVVIAVGFIFFSTIHSIHGGLPSIWQIGRRYGKWRVWDFSLNPASTTSFWPVFIGSCFLALATDGTDQAVLQRYLTAKSERECTRSLKAYSIILIPYNVVWLLIGVFLFAFYYQHPQLARNLHNADGVVPYFAVHQLPGIVGALLLASIFAASMGVVSAGINSLSTCSVVDFYQRIWKKNAGDAENVRAGRAFTIIWGTIATAGALYAGRLGRLATAFPKVQGFVGGVMLAVFLLGILFHRTTTLGVLIGGAGGIVVVSYLAFGTELSFFWYGAASCLSTVSLGYLISLCGAKPVGLPDYLFLKTFSHSTKKASDAP